MSSKLPGAQRYESSVAALDFDTTTQTPNIPIPARRATKPKKAGEGVNPLSWLLIRPERGRLTPITRIRLFIFGVVLLLMDAYLTYLFMLVAFPTVNTVWIDLAPAAIFTGSQIALLTKGHSPLAMVVLSLFFILNTVFNTVGLMHLLKVSQYAPLTLQGIFITTIAAAVGALGEMFISIASEKE
ncbi:MAG: hypothetical protein HXX08_11495 [Chloroflexi bacterium]|uniref:Uncharacterized protein n=1 Tax=Candidatus Chlorohelix allophototropha TaxID=3003348 RepID=A0A8T7LX05_9CHLR|nr:hypothetical protein [Chloroflexota bacterium]WJW65862.1 hypothetical protein OZ401_001641 [Chloroflexota bacterium L227-S17]